MTKTLVERLRDESERLSGRSLDRGCVDSGIAANLADEAIDYVEKLEAALWDAQISLDPEWETRWSRHYNELLSGIRNRATLTPSPLPQQP